MENLRRRTSTFDKCDAAYLQESPSERSAMFSSQPLLSSPQSTHFSSYSLLLAFEWLSFAYSFPQCPSSLDLQLSGQRIPVRSPRESRAFPLNVSSHSTPMHDRFHSMHCERTVKFLPFFNQKHTNYRSKCECFQTGGPEGIGDCIEISYSLNSFR